MEWNQRAARLAALAPPLSDAPLGIDNGVCHWKSHQLPQGVRGVRFTLPILRKGSGLLPWQRKTTRSTL